jgi:hypothetical protein
MTDSMSSRALTELRALIELAKALTPILSRAWRICLRSWRRGRLQGFLTRWAAGLSHELLDGLRAAAYSRREAGVSGARGRELPGRASPSDTKQEWDRLRAALCWPAGRIHCAGEIVSGRNCKGRSKACMRAIRRLQGRSRPCCGRWWRTTVITRGRSQRSGRSWARGHLAAAGIPGRAD